MDLSIVREFIILASSCNYQIAAENLMLSQSALSKHIQKLEEELGMPLFSRAKRTVSLNENGKVFLEYAREICKLCDECGHALQQQRSTGDTTLRIGFMKMHGQYGLIEQLADFMEKHSDIRLSAQELNGDQLKPMLTSGKCNFIFAADCIELDSEEYCHSIFRTDRLVAVLPAGHPLSHRDSINMQELGNERFIEHSTPLERQLFCKLCMQINMEPNIITSISYGSTVLRMVSQGIGISVMSNGCASQFSNFNVVKVDLEPRTEFNVYLIYRRRTRLSHIAKDFIEFFSEAEKKSQI